jgi:hypothetical protein
MAPLALGIGLALPFQAGRGGGGGVPPAGFAWLSDFEGNPVYDAEGVRLYGAI